ncbi:MAG TPA: hypothetical protein VFB59_04660 [Candidatus Saccharimonadales bacterium]|nr:hypothetical protein [Candidatus Saccharimonadales bacterium]
MAHETSQFVLPTLVFGTVEIRRLSRELETLDDYMRQASLRGAGSRQNGLPKVSRLLDATASENHLNLLQGADREQLAKALKQTLEVAPVIHISFASDPSAAFLEKIVSWLRTNVHPITLIRLGLQPSIAAGCVLRTANRAFDFSLRHHFTEQRDLLLYSLDTESPQESQPTQAANVPPAKKVEVVASE